MTAQPRFSIVIPTRNGAATIGATIRSALDQTYPHFTVHVLESGSTDATQDVVRVFGDPRVVLIPSEQPLDMLGNWRRILDLDLHEYLTILGHDDLLYPDFLAEIVRLIAAEPDASLYQTQIDFIDADGRRLDQAVVAPYALPVAKRETADEFIRALHHETEGVCATGYVVRSVDFRRIGGFPPFPNLLYADVAAWYRAAKPSYKACSERTLAAFRLHSGNAHRQSDMAVYYHACQHYLTFLMETDYFRAVGEAAARAYVEEFFFRTHRNTLMAIIQTDDPALQAAYRDDLEQVKVLYAADGRIRIDDRSTRMYRGFAWLPSRALRLAILEAYRRGKTLLRGAA
jgi:glycosyltransferase involved in cell wall biosynthesis